MEPHVDLNPLNDLRRQLTVRLGLLLVAAGSVGAWSALREEPFPVAFFWSALLLAALGIAVQALAGGHLSVARHLLIWGTTAFLLVAISSSSRPWLPFASLLLVPAGAVLIPGSELLIGLLVAGQVLWLHHTGVRLYPLLDLLALLILGVALAWLVTRILYTVQQWAWNAQLRSGKLLAEVRAHRAELSQALKSYELANNRLRRVERELHFAHQEAEKARRLKDQFAANVSHELRTPLNLIYGFSEMMHRSPAVYGELAWPANLRRDIYQIYRSSRHLLSMIDDILALSRFEHADFVLDRELTDLAELLVSTAEIAEDLFRTSAVELTVRAADDLPLLDVDRTRIRQVLLNLLNNALRFTEEGGVCLGAEQQGDEVMIWVCDTGPGIPAGKLSHIFEEFYQVDLSLRSSNGGAGLGLAISRRFVEAHDGRIWAESEVGVGTTFYVALPLPEQRLPLSRLHSSREMTSTSGGLQPALLVVDPDPAVAALVRRHAQGYDVRQVEQVDQVVAAIEEHCPRAVICNASGGNEPGTELPPLPIPVIECALPRRAWMRDELGVFDVLAKPVTAQQLLDALETLGFGDGRGRTLLVVDDDRGFCQLITRMLEASGEGYAVARAYEGEQGLQVMRTQRPDLVILDLVMQGMDGFELLAHMRADPELHDLPVLVVTATSYGHDVDRLWGDHVTIRRPGGLQPGEVLRWLPGLIDVIGAQPGALPVDV